LDDHHGSGNGIMEAGHVGAGRDHSIGLNILLPFEQSANQVILGDPKLMHLKYFFTRKLMFVKNPTPSFFSPAASALSTKASKSSRSFRRQKPSLSGRHGRYSRRRLLATLRRLLPTRLVAPQISLRIRSQPLQSDDVVDEAIEEVLGFYRVFHSMRYVRNDLVFASRKSSPRKSSPAFKPTSPTF